MLNIFEFVLRYFQEKEIASDIIKVKYQLSYQQIDTKKTTYAYFVLKMEQLNDFERQESNATQSYLKSLKRTISVLKYGETILAQSESTKPINTIRQNET